MIDDLNTSAYEIAAARKKVDRAFNSWYQQKKDLDDFIKQYKGDQAVLTTKVTMDLEECHFYKKQKTSS